MDAVITPSAEKRVSRSGAHVIAGCKQTKKSPSRNALFSIGTSAAIAHSRPPLNNIIRSGRINLPQHRQSTSAGPDNTTPLPRPFDSDFLVELNFRNHGHRVDRPVGTCVPEAASHLP